MIVPMERIRIVGRQADIDGCIKRLQEIGKVHITESWKDSLLSDTGLEQGIFQKDVSEKITTIETLLFEVRTALSLLHETRPSHSDILGSYAGQRDWFSANLQEEVKSITADIRQAATAIRMLNEEMLEIRRYRRLFEEFQPLIENLASCRNIEISGLLFSEKKKEIEKEIEKKLEIETNGAFSILKGDSGKTGYAVLLIYPASFRERVQERIFLEKSHRIQTVHIPEHYDKGTFASTLSHLFKREHEANREWKEWREKLRNYAVKWTSVLQTNEKGLKYELQRLRVKNFMALSSLTFWISGWIPSEDAPHLQNVIENEFKGNVLLYFQKPSLSEFGDVPVQLRNPKFARPFERLLAFFPPPMYGSVDPTLFMMLFFPLFFGLMLGDVGYALMLVFLAWLMRKQAGQVPAINDVGVIVYFCAFTTAVFGLLFGEFFGKLWFGLGLPPPLFDRKVEIIHLLMAVLVLGGIHLVTGKLLALKASVTESNMKHAVLAVADMAVISSVIWVSATLLWGGDFGYAPLIIVLSAAVKTVAGGVSELLELTKLITNLLSYARLMALGIASIILADLADDLYLVSDVILIGLIGAVLVHLLNFVLGVFSPTIQAIRLHYVEFFNQFYQHGFVKFSPFK